MFARIQSRLLNSNSSRIVKNSIRRGRVSTDATNVAETATVVYPPIEDRSPEGIRIKKKAMLAKKIQNLETVEEKLFALNMPRYYGFKCVHLIEGRIPYNTLELVQHFTKTHILKKTDLPYPYHTIISNEEMDDILPNVKQAVKDSILFENAYRYRKHEVSPDDAKDKSAMENIVANAIIYQINRIILSNLAQKYPHLADCQVDFEPRVEASWVIAGIDPTPALENMRRKNPHLKIAIDQKVQLPVQYLGSPVLQLRHKHPLHEILHLTEVETTEHHFKVPSVTLDPRTFGFYVKRRHLTNVPGFWPGDQSEFGLLSYHNCGHLLDRPEMCDDYEDALMTQGILASYSWLQTQACYQGFTIFNDLTYPLITQTIITNGQWWSFCVYQLNTIVLHGVQKDPNPRSNLVWMTQPMKLYDEVVNDEVIGFNDDVLKTLLKLYVNAPGKRPDTNMKPYLGEAVKVIADIEHDERRVWLEKHYKHLVTNKPRHRRLPERPLWQKIFCVDNKPSISIRRRDPWQFGINPYKRRLNQHKPRYVPKCLRANPKQKKVGRWENTYYPNV